MDTLSGIKMCSCAYIFFVRRKVRIYILYIIVQIKILKKICFVLNFYGPVPPVQPVPATLLDARIRFYTKNILRYKCTYVKKHAKKE